jgi:hypothetical protein
MVDEHDPIHPRLDRNPPNDAGTELAQYAKLTEALRRHRGRRRLLSGGAQPAFATLAAQSLAT